MFVWASENCQNLRWTESQRLRNTWESTAMWCPLAPTPIPCPGAQRGKFMAFSDTSWYICSSVSIKKGIPFWASMFRNLDFNAKKPLALFSSPFTNVQAVTDDPIAITMTGRMERSKTRFATRFPSVNFRCPTLFNVVYLSVTFPQQMIPETHMVSFWRPTNPQRSKTIYINRGHLGFWCVWVVLSQVGLEQVAIVAAGIRHGPIDQPVLKIIPKIWSSIPWRGENPNSRFSVFLNVFSVHIRMGYVIFGPKKCPYLSGHVRCM